MPNKILDKFIFVPTLMAKFYKVLYNFVIRVGTIFTTVLNKFANRSRCASMNKMCLSASITGRYGATLITFFISFLHKIFESTFQRGGAGLNKLGWAPP